MNVRDQLLALNDELRRLKAEGRRTVAVSEESLAALRTAVAAAVATPEPASTTNPAADAVPMNPGSPPSTAMPGAASKPARWVAAASDNTAAVPSTPPVVKLPGGDKSTRWNALKEQVMNDPVCRAHVRPGKKVVLGVGSLEASIFFCGEAPGAEEEVQGEPFVGPAGQLLTKMIAGMGLKREEVYIGNIMNWRPEMPAPSGVQYGNRPPTPEEMAYCLPYLRAQLEIVQPKLIVALGATASGGLLGAGTFKTLGEIRSRWHAFGGVPLMVTYHPSYILRNPTNRSKRMIWEDLLQVMERAGLPISPKQRNYYLG
ncbi:MAG TPA: uracil-DNA glycosylase [Candidatus Didemnitutus sp.]|nr:uracil-DNA glycosylase [Candidatus Didemnitutus sp.]